jgi:hypothetical protein
MAPSTPQAPTELHGSETGSCDLTLGVLGWPAVEVGGHGAGWAGQAAFAAVVCLLWGFLAGFLIAG